MLEKITLPVAARRSPLSQAQVKEVLQEIRAFYPYIDFQCVYVDTQGDKDQKTSLRILEKTDFFTKEVDALVLDSTCRLGIHSAKDLPDPLTAGLRVAAITRGVDSGDVLVLREGQSLESLPSNAVIATSSVRREEAVKALRKDLQFVDIRGTISQRLQILDRGDVDGVVIAEAALIRLGLTSRNRVRLPGPTTPFQGQLAVVVHEKDVELLTLFACLDTRQSRI